MVITDHLDADELRSLEDTMNIDLGFGSGRM